MSYMDLAADLARAQVQRKEPLIVEMAKRVEPPPPQEVYLLWMGVNAVVGIYKSREAATPHLEAALSVGVDAWVERREVQ